MGGQDIRVAATRFPPIDTHVYHGYLTEEFHYAVGRMTVEAVSGGMEANNVPWQQSRVP